MALSPLCELEIGSVVREAADRRECLRSGKPITPKERPRGENVVDLMDALRKSIGGAASETKAPAKSAKKPSKAAAGQKEMLMPIAGKKPAKETAAKKPASKSQRKSA
jgi:DNA end-binding protein Ku